MPTAFPKRLHPLQPGVQAVVSVRVSRYWTLHNRLSDPPPPLTPPTRLPGPPFLPFRHVHRSSSRVVLLPSVIRSNPIRSRCPILHGMTLRFGPPFRCRVRRVPRLPLRILISPFRSVPTQGECNFVNTSGYAGRSPVPRRRELSVQVSPMVVV